MGGFEVEDNPHEAWLKAVADEALHPPCWNKEYEKGEYDGLIVCLI